MTQLVDPIAAADTPPHRVQYELDTLRADFRWALDEFAAWTQSDKVRGVLGSDLLKQFRDQERRIRARLDSDFTLVVLGDFKRGKSSLINAWLQTPVAPTNITPETVTINEITYGPDLTVQACLTDGGKVPLAPGALKAAQLVPFLRGLPQQVDHIAITVPVPWLHGVRLVDTPGMGDLVNRFEDQITAYLPAADAIIYVISAASPMALNEQAFLRMAVAPQDFPKILFVVNRLDVAETTEDAHRVVDAVRDKLVRIFPNAQVFGLSARDELQRQAGGPRPNPPQGGVLAVAFAAFQAHLQEMVALQRNVIQLDRAADQFAITLDAFAARINLLRAALSTDQQRLGDTIAAYEAGLGTLDRRHAATLTTLHTSIGILQDEAVRWMDEFITRVQNEAITYVQQFPADAVQRHFEFFIAAAMRQAVRQCLAAHEPALTMAAQLAQQGLTADSFAIANYSLPVPDLGMLVADAAFSDRPWSEIDTAGVLLDLAKPGLGHLVVGVLDLTANPQRLQQYQRHLEQNLPNLRRAVAEQTRQAYQQVAEQIEATLTAATTQQATTTLAALRQAESLAGAEETRMAATREGLIEIATELDQTRNALMLLRQKLWTTAISGTP